MGPGTTPDLNARGPARQLRPLSPAQAPGEHSLLSAWGQWAQGPSLSHNRFIKRLTWAKLGRFDWQGTLATRLRQGTTEHLITNSLYPTGHQSLIHCGLSWDNNSTAVQFRSVWKVYDLRRAARPPGAGELAPAPSPRSVRHATDLGDIANEFNWAWVMRSPFRPKQALLGMPYNKVYVQYPVARGDLSFYLDAIGEPSQGDHSLSQLISVRLLLQLLPQLHQAHAVHEVRHNDIKETNIFVDDSCNLWLGDWGSAGTSQRPRSATWKYMRFELFIPGERYSTRAADLWALGKVLVSCLLGPGNDPFRLPYELDHRAGNASVHNAKLAIDARNTWQNAHATYSEWLKRCDQARKLRVPLPAFPWVAECRGLYLNQVFGAVHAHDPAGNRWLACLLSLFEPDSSRISAAKVFNQARYWWFTTSDALPFLGEGSGGAITAEQRLKEQKRCRKPTAAEMANRVLYRNRLDAKLLETSSVAHAWCTNAKPVISADLIGIDTAHSPDLNRHGRTSLSMPTTPTNSIDRCSPDILDGDGRPSSPDKCVPMLHPKRKPKPMATQLHTP